MLDPISHNITSKTAKCCLKNLNPYIHTSDCVPTWFGKGACDICRRYETSAQAINQNSYENINTSKFLAIKEG